MKPDLFIRIPLCKQRRYRVGGQHIAIQRIMPDLDVRPQHAFPKIIESDDTRDPPRRRKPSRAALPNPRT